MPSFQYSPSTDPSMFFDSSATWTLTQVSSTQAVWESGDQKLVVTGTGLSIAGGVAAGTITGVKLYDVDLSTGSAVDKQVMTNTTALSLSFSGLMTAVAESFYGFGGFGFIFGGNDTITGSTADDFISGYGGNDSIVGNAGNDYLSGDDELNEFGTPGGRDTLVGGDGNDYLSGGSGNDSMVGGNGNDYYFVTEAGDRVVESSGSTAGTADRVNFSSQNGLLTYTLPTNVENLEVAPVSMGSAPITVTANGNAGANKITVIDLSGGFMPSSSTRLFGLDGNDRLTGGPGRDSLDGGVGNDTMIGGLGSDTYTVNVLTDVVSEAISFPVPNSDIDTLIFAVTSAATVSLGGTVSGLTATKTYSGIERLTLGSASSTPAHNGIGNDAANLLTGNAGANRLYGLNGNDTLNGGAGNDQLWGGAGNDTIDITSKTGSDRVNDFKLSGSDKLRIDQSDLAVKFGDGDTVVEGAVSLAGPGGFAKTAELVIITSNISGTISTTTAAAKIGSATATYAVGDDRIFVVDNGTDSAVYLFTAVDADAAVEANELTLLATLAGTASTVTTDYLFGA